MLDSPVNSASLIRTSKSNLTKPVLSVDLPKIPVLKNFLRFRSQKHGLLGLENYAEQY